MRCNLALALLAVVTLLAVQLLAPVPALACSIVAPPPDDLLERADAVFVGTVVDAREERRLDTDGRSYTLEQTNRFRVISSWKGVSTPEVTILFRNHVAFDESGNRIPPLCPEPHGFTPGAMYLVRAFRSATGNDLESSIVVTKSTDALTTPSRRIQGLMEIETEITLFGEGTQWNRLEGASLPKAGVSGPSIAVSLALWSIAVGLGSSLLGGYLHRRV